MMLEGKVAIVTGSSQGIGLGIAKVLVREGARVVINTISLEPAVAAAREIDPGLERTMPFVADVTSLADVKAMVRETVKKFGQLDILVNNAVAPSKNSPFWQTDPADWDTELGAGLKGYLNCTRAVLEPMLEKNSGRIIHIASSAGKVGSPNLAVYSAAKGAIISFTKALARELAQTGITVNSVAPGAVHSPMQDRLSDEFRKYMLTTIPMNRLGYAEEVGEMVAFLASDRSSYITGQVYSVDGGRTMQ
jgi:NAD(P)-dependent dehydrogenase (short-subunit alcohol dehydrogenase family)